MFDSDVRTARKAKNWTQQQLADAAELSLQTVKDIEGGKPPSPKSETALRAALSLKEPSPDDTGDWDMRVQVPGYEVSVRVRRRS